jgi:DNA polymerase IV
VGEVAQLRRRSLAAMLGPAAGNHLYALAHGLDPRPVESGRRRRSIGSQCALGRRERTNEELEAILAALLDRVARRLRSGRRVCHTVVVRFRFGDFSRATRSHTLAEATDETPALLATARLLLRDASALIERKGLTLLGVALSNLDDASAVQLALPMERCPAAALDTALDALRERYGSGAVGRASTLGRRVGQPVPILPD